MAGRWFRSTAGPSWVALPASLGPAAEAQLRLGATKGQEHSQPPSPILCSPCRSFPQLLHLPRACGESPQALNHCSPRKGSYLVFTPWAQDEEHPPGNSPKQAPCQGSELREGWAWLWGSGTHLAGASQCVCPLPAPVLPKGKIANMGKRCPCSKGGQPLC